MRGMNELVRGQISQLSKLKFIIEEDYALDILTIASLVHKKLDNIIFP